MPDWLYFVLSTPVMMVLAFFLRSLFGIALPKVTYSRSAVATLVLVLSICNYCLAGAIPTWISGNHHSPFVWLVVTLIAIALSISIPSLQPNRVARR